MIISFSLSRIRVALILYGLVSALFASVSFGQEFKAIEEDPIIDPRPPHPGLVFYAANIRDENPHHDVKLYFPWWLDVDISTVGDGDIAVKGPNGYESKGVLVDVKKDIRVLPIPKIDPLAIEEEFRLAPDPQHVVVATYRIFSPSGEDQNWSADDNGIYAVRLVKEEIATQSGRFLPSEFLGSFLCAIRIDPGDTIQPSSVRCAVKPHRVIIESGDATLENDPLIAINPLGYHAIVYASFRTPHVEINWGSSEREGNTITVEAKAIRLPIAVPDIQPIPLPLAKAIESEGDAEPRLIDPDFVLPEILPIFRHRYDLGSLPSGTYQFVFKVNGIVECTDSFTVPPVVPIDMDPPVAELGVRDIHKPTDDAHKILVTYKDRSGVDVSTIGDSDIVVFGPRVFDGIANADLSVWYAQRVRLVEIVSVSTHSRIVKALYEISAPSNGWSDRHNGLYRVVLWEEAVCDRLENCVERQSIGSFKVAIEDESQPIPAKAEIRVDASNPDRVVTKVHIEFKEHWLVVDQNIRRDGNRIYCVATAVVPPMLNIFPPPPPPQQDLLYEIGPLEDGEYGVVFVMNGHVFDKDGFAVLREPPVPAKVELQIDTTSADAVFADVTIQFLTPHQVIQGEVEVNGHRVILPAKAKPLPIAADSAARIFPPSQPEPVHLRYELGELEPGGYVGAFVMNDFVYAVEPFKIEPAGPPIPAEVVLRVDQDNENNTIILAKIEFQTPHAIVGQHIHRRENSFVLETRAVPIDTLASAEDFAPILLPQVVWVRFPLGDLDADEYKATFTMNGWPYARVVWDEPEDRLKAVVSIDVEELDTGAWQARVKILFENPWARISDEGEVMFDGHVIRINATAEAPDIVPAVVIEPEPIELIYDLGELMPGGYWLKYSINGNFEKQHDFFVRPEGPIPAKVDLTVASDDQPVIATATIQFRDHYRIEDQNMRRIGNLFVLDATADGPLPLRAAIPPPPTKVDYELGELPEGLYFAAFRMNGFFYDFVQFTVDANGGFEAEVELKIEVDEHVKLTAIVDIDDPFVIVTDAGEPVIDGNIVRIFATAERVTFIAPPSGDPMTFEYELGELDAGKYRLIYYINEKAEASAGFIVPELPKPPVARISHIKISEGDASWLANVGVILLPGQEVIDWGKVRHDGNTFHVNVTVEWVDFAPPIEPLPMPDISLLPDGVTRDAEGDARIGIVPIRIVTHDYVLGVLVSGEYKFVVHSRDQVVAKKAFEVGDSAPIVELDIDNIHVRVESHEFRISFSDLDGLDHESIMKSEVWIAGGLGRRLKAELIDYASTDDFPSTHGFGRYSVEGPGGNWNARDNGLYCVFVDPEAIRDLNGNHIERKRLGCFRVRIAPEPPQTGVNVSVNVNELGEWEANVEVISESGNQIVVDSWDPIIHHGHSIVALASVHIDSHGGPIEPLAHTYNLGTLDPGYYVFVFKTNLAHCGAASFVVPGEEGDPIDRWIGRVDGSIDGDSDGDGLTDVGEYFFATDPNRKDTAFVRPEIVTSDDGQLHMGLRFRRVHGAEGMIQVVEGSARIGAWEDVNERIDIVEQTVLLDGTEEILICLREPIMDSSYQFIRLRVTRDLE